MLDYTGSTVHSVQHICSERFLWSGYMTQELDYTVIDMKDKQIPGGDRERFLLHKYKKLADSSLKKLDNVYLLHYPLMDGGFVRRESAYVVKFLSGKFSVSDFQYV